MKIGIVDADLIGRKRHRFPNLVCEKLSGHWKEKGALHKMLLRDICVKTMVKAAPAGPVRYRTIVSCLSDSTAGRRKSNVKFLINFVLSGTEYEDILIKIDWTV